MVLNTFSKDSRKGLMNSTFIGPFPLRIHSPLSTSAVKPELAATAATSGWAVIGITEIFVGRDTIADALLQFFEFGKSTNRETRPNKRTVHPHFEHAATARHQ